MAKTPMWLVKYSPEQGTTVRVFVRGPKKPEVACEVALEKMGHRGQGRYVEAMKIHAAITVKEESDEESGA